MKNGKITLALVDDHQIVIDGLTSLLKGHDKFKFAFATTDSGEVVERIAQTPIDVLLTDVMMPKLPGNQLAKQVKEKYPHVKILALSMSGQGDLVNEMIEDADIAGYVLKNIGKQELITALEKIAGGGIYFSEEVIDELQRTSQRKKQNAEVHLTDREIEITRLIEKEYNNKQIAETLFISERTVETHRKNIFRKTNTNSVIGLVKYAYEHKLI
ncbi:MAG: response regulator transcription factor [Chitinophagaceae bacterium]|jgi:DNA-binding NarL/FixJ family response regulator|nr:response regulator transcription factor [Chitinophagaceae bacterium]MBK7680456.1 response regulator transcription factor [Chitinophagaceae bacterium]MBK8300748.1 response regulator transcription factor [Chitinophagaceae bacterium]MBK9465756.1 response regulator transcription factor [Chitinophagaceae bacterium]MBK9661046.1 response regulator transcription factor [Chitinophagaceae bacterium]